MRCDQIDKQDVLPLEQRREVANLPFEAFDKAEQRRLAGQGCAQPGKPRRRTRAADRPFEAPRIIAQLFRR